MNNELFREKNKFKYFLITPLFIQMKTESIFPSQNSINACNELNENWNFDNIESGSGRRIIAFTSVGR